MKFRRIEDNKIIEVKDKNIIAKYQGYPDLFEEIKETKPKFKKEDK